MALQLNDAPSRYQEFAGRYNEQMPQLIADGRTPMSVADIMRRRLEVANSTPDVRSAWMDNYFDTGDAVLYHPSGKLKVVLDAAPLRAITPQDTLDSGALLIDHDLYRRLDGPTFSRSEVQNGRSRSEQDVLTHPVWNALAREDKALLREYTHLVFTDAKQRFTYDANTGIYLNATPETPALRAWFVSSINDRSDLYGYTDLDDDYGCLVGVAPEAHADKVVGFVMPTKNADGANPTKTGTFLYQQDGPSCSDCGEIMVRNGACYKCLNCGSTSGCS